MKKDNGTSEKTLCGPYIKAGRKADLLLVDRRRLVSLHGLVKTGTWEPDPGGFPRVLNRSRLRAAQGIKLIVWFEPERWPRTWLAKNHPEWLLGTARS